MFRNFSVSDTSLSSIFYSNSGQYEVADWLIDNFPELVFSQCGGTYLIQNLQIRQKEWDFKNSKNLEQQQSPISTKLIDFNDLRGFVNYQKHPKFQKRYFWKTLLNNCL